MKKNHSEIYSNINDIKENDKTNKNKNLSIKKTYRKDNIRSKIIYHFCNFLISFLNDYVKKIYNQQKVLFIKINYQYIKNVNIASLKFFMNNTIKDFCKYPTYSKGLIFNKYHNHENLLIIQNDLGEKFINQKLSEFYQNYYLKDSSLINEQFGLHEETKNFQGLLDIYEENKIYQKIIKECSFKLINDFIKRKPRNRYNKEIIIKNTKKSERDINNENEQNNLLSQEGIKQNNFQLNFSLLNEENCYNSKLLSNNVIPTLFNETYNFGNIY